MKIISKIPDYYDYISKIYGEDDKIVFNRNLELDFSEFKIPDVMNPYNLCKYIELKLPFQFVRKTDCTYVLLIYCGIPFLYRYSIFDFKEEYHYCKNAKNEFSNGYMRYYINQYDYLEKVNPFLLELHKKLKSPIFTINNFFYHDKIPITLISKKIPILSQYHFQNIREPEICWQEISQFISLHFNSNDPPLELNNNEKIIKAGFDLKKSFRGK